eukprot:GFKZ01008763.1.p1 GENE.GFKZ01008763.1~~GFKZ01008763.1.p1  ORF type:complete len:351 (-),score=43.65 GFKZ01008763.1:283-1335(-)
MTKPSKRICLFSDGTWMTPETPTPSNIIRLLTLTLPNSSSIPQLTFYDPGVGTGPLLLDVLLGGSVGFGLSQNILQLYTFLATNYVPGDEIYLFGYSRGAFTIRSLAGLINVAGLVRREEIEWVKEAYDLYESKVDPEGEAATEFRRLHGDRVNINCMVCFDTVGALGLPFELPWPLSKIFNTDRFRFHNTKLSQGIEHAIHILSVDEERKLFAPIRMTAHEKRGKGQVTELFFPGGHGGVGGGEELEVKLAENALRFVVKEMKRRGCGLEFRDEDLPAGGDVEGEYKPRREISYELLKWVGGVYVRDIRGVDICHESVVRRWARVTEWRPTALTGINQELQKKAEKMGW